MVSISSVLSRRGGPGSVIGVVGVLLLLPALVSAQTGSLVGVVRDAYGDPVPQAHVVLERDGREVASATTDGAGRYRLSPAIEGRQRVRIEAAGSFAPGSSGARRYSFIRSMPVIASSNWPSQSKNDWSTFEERPR